MTSESAGAASTSSGAVSTSSGAASATAAPTFSVGYAAMLEQFHPSEVVDLCEQAERHGFSGVMAADHFQPWVPEQGHSAFVWNVLTAIGERTVGDLGPGVTCPSFRWHPAMVAQASATLAAMCPGRHWLGLGSGEALNEHVVGGYWPEAPQRPEMYVATAGPVTAKRTGRHADGIITVGAPLEKIEGLFGKFADGAREAGKDPDTMPKILQLHLSWASSDAEAMENALTQWPNGGMKFPKGDIRSPHDFAAMAALVRPEDFEGRMVISSDPDVHRANIQRFLDLGFDRVYLHNVGRNQGEWLETFGREVLPKLHR